MLLLSGAAILFGLPLMADGAANELGAWTENAGRTSSATLSPGQVKIFRFPAKINKVFSGAGQIADVTFLSGNAVVVTAKQYGEVDIVGVSEERADQFLKLRIVVLPPSVPSSKITVFHGAMPVREYHVTKEFCCGASGSGNPVLITSNPLGLVYSVGPKEKSADAPE